MKLPAGSVPYLEATLTFPRNGSNHNVSVIGDCRIADQNSILAFYRSSTVSMGTKMLA